MNPRNFLFTILSIIVINNSGFSQDQTQPSITASVKKLSKKVAISTKKEVVYLHNFSDSVYTIQLPQKLLYHYKCEEFEKLYDELKDLSISNQYQVKEVYDNCGEELITLSNGMKISEKYFTNEEYFNVWDSKNVNPYDYPLKHFNDTVVIELYNKMKGLDWAPPIRNTKINSNYGQRWYRWHHGVDLDLEIGDPVYAAFDGVVRIAKYNRGGYGNYVMLRHENGLETLYGHLKSYNVQEGDFVKAGSMIGLGGNTGRSTGAHLHFEVRYKGHAFNPKYLYDFTRDRLHFSEFYLTPSHYKGLRSQNSAKYHRIRRGDSLWVISRRYRTSISRLCRLNGISRRTTLRIGRRLRVR